jgi:hypothetical protein
MTRSCCFMRRLSATMALAPPGPSSLATVVDRCTRSTSRSFTAEQGRGDCFQGQDCLSYRFQATITNSPHTGQWQEYTMDSDTHGHAVRRCLCRSRGNRVARTAAIPPAILASWTFSKQTAAPMGRSVAMKPGPGASNGLKWRTAIRTENGIALNLPSSSGAGFVLDYTNWADYRSLVFGPGVSVRTVLPA